MFRQAVFACPAAWPLCNTSLPLDERIADFMSSLSTNCNINAVFFRDFLLKMHRYWRITPEE